MLPVNNRRDLYAYAVGRAERGKTELLGNFDLTGATNHQDAFDVIQFLAEMGADLNARKSLRDWSPLHIAVMNSYENAVRLLLDEGVELDLSSPEDRQWPPFYYAIRARQISLLFIDRMTPIHAIDGHYNPMHGGWIHRALTYNNLEVVNYLLREHADLDINAQNSSGHTPLDVAIRVHYNLLANGKMR